MTSTNPADWGTLNGHLFLHHFFPPQVTFEGGYMLDLPLNDDED